MLTRSLYINLKIAVHFTRAPVGKFPVSPEKFTSPGLTLNPGRPNLSKVLDKAISRAISLESVDNGAGQLRGMLVGVCGPVELGDAVADAVGMIEPPRRDQMGGVELHEE